MELPRFRFGDLVALLLVVGLAGVTRAGYVYLATDAGQVPTPVVVQDPSPSVELPPGTEMRGRKDPTELDNLVQNLQENRWFGSLAPLAPEEERTAHVAPGYPWLFGLAARWLDHPESVILWAQCVLGAVTAGFYYLFARRAFFSPVVATVAGVFCALHPFWVLNTAELKDGVLASFLLASVLYLGTRGGQTGDGITGLAFGLSLAGLAMVRAALLPFTVVALLWFLVRCRSLRRGWFGALLAFLGFANGLLPWGVRNFQVFGEPVPVANSVYLHLWVGNNPRATGGPLGERAIREVLSPDRVQALTEETNQARRYSALGRDAWEEIRANPAATLGRRLWAGLYFVFGEAWFKENTLSRTRAAEATGPAAEGPAWLTGGVPGLLRGTLLALLLLGFLGWRWSHGWRIPARLAALAMIWVPLPYLLSHAGELAGPRLPLDGVLLCYGAFALVSFIPSLGGPLALGYEGK